MRKQENFDPGHIRWRLGQKELKPIIISLDQVPSPAQCQVIYKPSATLELKPLLIRSFLFCREPRKVTSTT